VAVPAGRDSRLRRVDWRTKNTMPFLRSAAEPSASLGRENTSVASVLQVFRAAKTGDRYDRLVSLEGGVQPGVHGVGEVVMPSADATGGTLMGKLARRAIFRRYCEAKMARAKPLLRKQICQTLGK
jgi:hypothetical protein